MARGSRGLHEAGRRWPLRSVGWTSRPVPGPGSQLRPPLCVPLSTPPRLPALSLHCSPSFLSSVLLFSPPPPVPCFLAVCVRLPFLCAPPSQVSIFFPLPQPLSCFFSFFLAFSWVSLSVCPQAVPALTASFSPCRPVPVSSLPGLVCLPVALPVSPPAFREGSHDL